MGFGQLFFPLGLCGLELPPEVQLFRYVSL